MIVLNGIHEVAGGNMSFWVNKRVVVTGGGRVSWFLLVSKQLKERGAKDIFVPRSRDYDLVEMEAVRRLYRDARPEIVVHLAAKVGGIGANRANPGKFFYENLMMGVQMMEVATASRNRKICGHRHHLRLSEVYSRFPLKKKTCGTATPKKPMLPMVLQKKCFWFRHRLTGSSTDLMRSIFCR